MTVIKVGTGHLRRPISRVDCMICLILEDINIRIDCLVTFNEKDYGKKVGVDLIPRRL